MTGNAFHDELRLDGGVGVRLCEDHTAAQLLAIVAVDQVDRVRCGQPGCGHGVYRRIHIVSESGNLMVLGSTCFAKRFGGDSSLGAARFGGGDGRMLTDEERQLLVHNTQALIARFEEEALLAQREQERQRVAMVTATPAAPHLRQRLVPRQTTAAQHPRETPWAWVKPMTTVLYLKLMDGSGWIRAKRNDGQDVFVPWPSFDGWDEAWPAHFGQVDLDSGGYVVSSVEVALRYLRTQARWETAPGCWRDVMKDIDNRTKGASQFE